jgi:hypothetical protein
MRSELTAAVVYAPIMVKKHGAALLCQDAKLRDATRPAADVQQRDTGQAA